MATVIYSGKIDNDNKVRVLHGFIGESELDARRLLGEHANDCPKFGPAHRNGRTIEIVVDDVEYPEPTEDGISEFLAYGFEDEDEEPEEDDDEEPEEEDDDEEE